MKITIKKRDKHKYFPLLPTKCSGCGKYFFLEEGSRSWSTAIPFEYAEKAGCVFYYCNECTEAGKNI